jgi:phosphate transport system permease protein
VFVGINGFRVFGQGATVQEFFFSTNWDPTGGESATGAPSFGAAGLILGSVVVTIFSVLIATPLAFGMALFFTEVSPPWLSNFLNPLIELFTGMPSVVIGFLGLTILVPFVQKLVAPFIPGPPTQGFGWGTAILVLVIMILPTIISISIDSLRAVPVSVREASLALGATRWRTMSRAIVPAAAIGLATAVVLGMARAIGETLAVALVLGGSALPTDLFTWKVFFGPNVNITQAIANGFNEALGPARNSYYTLALVLLIISLLFILFSRYLASRSVYQ